METLRLKRHGLREILAQLARPRYSFLSAGSWWRRSKEGPSSYGEWIQRWSDGQSQHGHHAV